jgi:hypothetical protein
VQGGKVVVHDAALATLTRSVAARPPGVLLWRDEPTPWLSALARETRYDRPRGPFIDAWSAADNLPVSVLCSLHPDGLVEALEGTPDGLAARFLFAWPSPPAQRGLSADAPPREDEAVTMLHRLAGTVGTAEKPLVLAFEEDAVKAFDRFLVGLCDEIRCVEGLQAGWLGRGRGTIPRLAAAFTLLAWSERPGDRLARAIGREQLQAATRLWQDYFRPHARAVFDRGAPTTQDRQTRRVVHWLRRRKAREVSREDIRRSALCQSATAAAADQVIYRLEAAGILRGLRDEPFSHNGRPARRWQVNPALVLPVKAASGVAESAETPSDADAADVPATPSPALTG